VQDNLDNLRGKHALIVDDEELIREIFLRELEDLGVSVDEAENGNIAFEKINAKDYDFVISDVRMPGGSGKELLERISKEGKDVFIIMVTGFSDLSIDEAKRLGAKHIFEKPFKIDDIFEFIASNMSA
jgi:DNA-binding NtrC family response regulator